MASLRENIETLSELEGVLECSGKELAALERILAKQEAIEAKDYALLVNEILLQIAKRDALRAEIEKIEKEIRLNTQEVESNRERTGILDEKLKAIGDQLIAINVSMQENASGRLAEDAKKRMENIEAAMGGKQAEVMKLQEQQKQLKYYLGKLRQLDYRPVDMQEAELLTSEADGKEKEKVPEKMEAFERSSLEEIRDKRSSLSNELEQLGTEIDSCNQKSGGTRFPYFFIWAESGKRVPSFWRY